MSLNSVEVRGAAKSYGKKSKKHVVINNFNMNVQQGSIYCLLGSSGCGKTTLLSSIMGMIKLDAGDIKVLGSDKASKVSRRIGYMPQETALVGELTVKETIFYFGNIFEMNSTELNIRYEMLKSLLELPPDDMRIDTCSGGEMRRISFAAACIHEPDLLILDEPTVGLDPLLRNKIWSFLFNVTRTSKLSVIITTHYIAEAQKSDRVGFMRNGALLAEDAPRNILTRYEVETLDDAFLAMCSNEMPSALQNAEEISPETFPRDEKKFEIVAQRSSLKWQTVSAILTKHTIQFKRQPVSVILTLLVPIIQAIIFSSAIGGVPKGLKVAIVDQEVSDCFNSSSFISRERSCYPLKASCSFLANIRKSTAEKVFYESFEEAFHDAKKGKVLAIVLFKKNFTESLIKLHDNGVVHENSQIQIFMDQTNLQLTLFLQKKLFDAYTKFSEDLSVGCKLPKKLRNAAIDFQEPIYGRLNADHRMTMAPCALSLMSFISAMSISVGGLTSDRKEGMWNRSLLAGVRVSELMVAHALMNSLLVFIQLIELVVLVHVLVDFEMVGNYGVGILMLLLSSVTGMMMGIVLSTMVEDFRTASFIIFACAESMNFLCGFMWPIEGMPTALRYFSFCLPLTLPAIAIRNDIFKGYGIRHPSAAKAFGVLIVWVSISSFLALKFLKMRKFSRFV